MHHGTNTFSNSIEMNKTHKSKLIGELKYFHAENEKMSKEIKIVRAWVRGCVRGACVGACMGACVVRVSCVGACVRAFSHCNQLSFYFFETRYLY